MRSTRLAIPPLLLACAILVGLLAPVAEAAKRGPCIPGQKKPTCRIWKAKVMNVADGDTFNAKIREKGRWSPRKDIRMLGVQAMELTDYSRPGRKGYCHGVEAAERLERLLQGRKIRRRIVRLAAFKKSSQSAGRRGRLRRGVQYKSGGRWHDAGTVLVREGHALWDPNAKEWAWNKSYSKLAAQAAGRGIGIWDTDSCGAGPQQDIPLGLKVKWDANGIDGRNLNGEWVRISNTHPTNPISLKGWTLRDAFLRSYKFLRTYKFPEGAVIPAGGSLQVHVGKGNDTPTDYYWGEPASVFQNVEGGRRAVGDGAYLFDPQGDIRAWQQYPCKFGCADPARRRVAINAHKTPPESVTVTNQSDSPLNLGYYEIESSPWFYEFPGGFVLQPRESVRVVVQRDPARDLPLLKGWGFKQYLFADKKDVVSLRNVLGAPVACDSWGRGPRSRCPRV